MGHNDLNEVDPEDVKIPVVRLDNGSDHVAKHLREARDKFFIEQGNIVLGEEFRCWVLWRRRGHVLLPNDKHPAHIDKNSPTGLIDQCYSMDRKQGTVYGSCKNCGMHSWKVAEREGWRKPACDETDTFGLLIDEVGPAIFSVRSSSGKQCREFADNLGRQNFFRYPMVFSVRQETRKINANEEKTFNVPFMNWDRKSPVPADMHEKLRVAAEFLIEHRKQTWEGILERFNKGEESSQDTDETPAPF